MTLTGDRRAPARDPGRMLWIATAAAWAAVLVLTILPVGMTGMPSMAVGDLAEHGVSPLVVATFVGSWTVMVAAMMLPTTVPTVRFLGVVAARQGPTGRILAVFLGAYVVVWLAVGLVALAGATAVGRATHGVRAELVLAGALGLAGVIQFSPLKRRCLTICRDPRAFLFTHYRRGLRGAWALGVRHALSCAGCCWALMLVMFATGVAGLGWMLGLTAVMVAEKVAPWGRRIVAPVGVVLLAGAVALVVVALTTPGAPGPPMPMQMPM